MLLLLSWLALAEGNRPPVAKPASFTLDIDAVLKGQLVATDPDGDPLTFRVDREPSHGSVLIGKKSGKFAYTPLDGWKGDDELWFVVTDGKLSASAAVQIHVGPPSTTPAPPPTTPPDPIPPAPAPPLPTPPPPAPPPSPIPPAPVPPPAPPPLPPSTTPPPPAPPVATPAPPPSPVVVANAPGPAPVVVAVPAAPVPVVVAIPPRAEPLVLRTLEDTAVKGRVVARGAGLTYAVARGPAHGDARVDDNGDVVFTPAKDWNGDDAFTVDVASPTGAASAAVTVHVAAVNDAPVASAGTVSTDEDHAGTGQLVASDVDGDALSYAVPRSAAHGAVVVDARTGAFTYTPAPGFHGDDSFGFTASDGNLAAASTVVVRVAAVQHAPKTSTLALRTLEDTAVKGRVVARGAGLSYAVAHAPAHGDARVEGNGDVAFTPAKDWSGDDAFSVDVTSPGGTARAEVTVHVVPVNDAPTASAASIGTDEDHAVTGQLAGADVDGDALSYAIPPSRGAKHGVVVVDEKTGAFTYTPHKDWNGDDAFGWAVSDGKLAAFATVAIHVAAVNDAPTLASLALKTDEDVPVRGKLSARDVDGDVLHFAVAQPSFGAVVVDEKTGAFTYTPGPDKNGADRFTASVSDEHESASADVTVDVRPVPDAPRVDASVVISTNEDTPVTATLPGSDADGDPLTFAIVKGPKRGSAVLEDAGTGRFRYTPQPDKNGDDALDFEVKAGGQRAAGTLKIHVAPVNDPPVLAAANASTDEDAPVDVRLHATDVDGDALTFAVATPPKKGTVTVAGDVLHFVPALNDNGEVAFTAVAKDASSSSAPAAIVVQVKPVNDAPTVQDLTISIDEDTPLVSRIKAVDVDGDKLRYRVGQGPVRGSLNVDPVDGSFTFSPAHNVDGAEQFTVVVADPLGLEATATVRVTIRPVDDPPEAVGSRIIAPHLGRVVGKLDGHDPEGHRVTYRIVQQPGIGKVELVDARGGFAFVTDGSGRGETSFLFVVNDGTLDSAPAKVDVTVR